MSLVVAAANEGTCASRIPTAVATPPIPTSVDSRPVPPSAVNNAARSDPTNHRNASAPSITNHAPHWIAVACALYFANTTTGLSLLSFPRCPGPLRITIPITQSTTALMPASGE